MGAVMLIASADELKAEQAAGDQMIDMIAPLLQQLSLGSFLVCALHRKLTQSVTPGE